MEEFESDKQKYVRQGLPNGGILGFKRSESGEGYDPINVPGAEMRQVHSGRVDGLQLEDGR
jgi:inosine/xanthosine triphosphate pyrophosphatase family protein